MSTDKIMHFVYFETKLDSEEFTAKWENFLRSENGDAEVVLQESKSDKMCRYIAQHCCNTEEFLFTFTKAAKTTRTKEPEIKTIQLGGYSIVQEEKTDDTKANESKVFVFLNYHNNDFNHYRQAGSNIKLNIYEAYYENCVYAYILEYFVKNNYIAELEKQLKNYGVRDMGIYKECNLKTV